jgi:hypothetical protein
MAHIHHSGLIRAAGQCPLCSDSDRIPCRRRPGEAYRANARTRHSRSNQDRSFHYNAAIKEPIVTSFGSIPARNALLIRIEDRDGAFGWGEVWQTFRLPELRASCDCSRR